MYKSLTFTLFVRDRDRAVPMIKKQVYWAENLHSFVEKYVKQTPLQPQLLVLCSRLRARDSESSSIRWDREGLWLVWTNISDVSNNHRQPSHMENAAVLPGHASQGCSKAAIEDEISI